MKRPQILLLASILVVSIFLMIVYRKRIEDFKNNDSGDSQTVTFYTDKSYKGDESKGLVIGQYTSADMITNNVKNPIKSIKVRGNYQVRLYPMDNFYGEYSTYESSEPKLDDPTDFEVKSIKIFKKHTALDAVVFPPPPEISVPSPVSSPSVPPATTLPLPLPLPVTSQSVTPTTPIVPPPLSSPAKEYVVNQHIIPIDTTNPSTYSPVAQSTNTSSIDYDWIPVPANQ